VPGRPEAQPIHRNWLARYQPLVEEGTWAWLEVADSGLWNGPLPADVVASVFANREFHLVLANYGAAPAAVRTIDSYVPVGQPRATPQSDWRLGPRSLHLLKRVG
jgi:hypothetical protein